MSTLYTELVNKFKNIFGYNGIEDESIPERSIEEMEPQDFIMTPEKMQSYIESLLDPRCRIYKSDIFDINKLLEPKRKRLLTVAEKLITDQYVTEESFNELSEHQKIDLLFKIKDSQIKCRDQFMQHFIGKDGDYTKKFGALLPIKELSQHIMSFVYPVLPSAKIAEAWTMAEDRLAKMREKTNTGDSTAKDTQLLKKTLKPG